MPPNSRPNRTMLRRALFLLAACGIAAFAVLMLQLFRLQILRHDELEAEREMLLTAMDRLAPGGRLCVISFHSLEDRIVKTAIREREDGCTCPRDFPVCVCGFVQTMKTVTKPITASEEELNDNPRARSARLRVAERI